MSIFRVQSTDASCNFMNIEVDSNLLHSLSEPFLTFYST